MNVANLTAHLSRRSGGLASAVPGLHRACGAVIGCRSFVVGVVDPALPGDVRYWGANGEVFAASALGPRSFSWAPDILTHLSSLRPDILHAHGLWMFPSWANVIWHKRSRTPYVISPHGMLDPWAVRRSAWKKRLVGRVFEDRHLRRARALRALNIAEARAIRSYGLRGPIVVIPNGVDLPEVRSRPNYTDVRTLLFLGRLDPKKRLLELIDAWARTRDHAAADAWRLRLVGWGRESYVREVKDRVESLHLGDSVELCGPVYGPERDHVLASAHAFILPSASEGLPMAVLEAWSYGLPTLISEACNLPEGFTAGAAWRAGPGCDSIAAALTRLYGASQGELRAMGDAGRGLVERQFAWPEIGRRMVEVYAWILGGGSPPSCVITD